MIEDCETLEDIKGGKKHPVSQKMALCRCGGSSNKPFCDSTHVGIGFSDAKEGDRVPDKRETFDGKEITVHDNRGVCAHAGFCSSRG